MSRRTVINPLQVRDRIRAALPATEVRVELYEPRFHGSEKTYVSDCIDTAWVSYAGAYVEKFENALAQACGTAHAVCVSSGTVALQIALWAAGIGAGDEVIVPSLTFVATANAIVHTGATPHFVDCDELSLGMAPSALRAHLENIGERRDGVLRNRISGARIAALLPVHIFGHPCDMDALNTIAAEFSLAVIEDATESLGSRYKNLPSGSLAPLAALSFNGNKIVTTGGGGAILTGDALLAQRIKHMTTTAKRPHRWAFLHDEVAWNFRLPNLNAALGLAQMEQLPWALDAKRRLHDHYVAAFSGVAGMRIFSDAPFARSNYWLVTLILDAGQEDMLEPVLEATNGAGLATRPAWVPMHQLPMYRDAARAPLPVTESLARRIVNLPSSPFLAPT